MKKTLALILAVVMCATLVACAPSKLGGNTDATGGGTQSPDNTGANKIPTVGGNGDSFGSGVTITVMLMPQGDMNDATVKKVTDAVNARIGQLGYGFKVKFAWSGGAWGFDTLDVALQTGSADYDIIPAHSWSGSVTYTVGAKNGQYVRLDDPANNLLEKYGPDLYGKTASAVKSAAMVAGDQGFGIYGYIIEKDSVQQNGYLVNKSLLEELGFGMGDFDADNIATWERIFKAYKERFPTGYPLNVEAEVLDRTINHNAFVSNTTGPLGVIFNNGNVANTKAEITSRYEDARYKGFVDIMHRYYEAGYIDPDQGVPGEISSSSIAARRTSGDFLVTTFVYAPGAENMIAASASAAQGKDVEIVWAPGWTYPIATAESAQGSGLAVYAGSKHVPEAVMFLNILASDFVIGNLLSEGIEGESYTVIDGVAWRNDGRAGWNIWRYGVVGANSGATPLGDVDANGNEWENFKSFNNAAKALPSSGFVFDVTNVDTQYSACVAVIAKYAIPLGSGAADPASYNSFMNELKSAGVDAVVSEANAQLKAFLGN